MAWFGCLGPGLRNPVMGYPIFQEISSLAQGRMNPPFTKQLELKTALVKGGIIWPVQS